MIVKVLTLLSLLATTLAKSHLSTNECLSVGESIYSENNCFRFKLEKWGNLAIDKLHFGTIWNIGLEGQGTNKVCMQDDGNLVAYDANNKALWATMKLMYPPGSTTLTMQDDGNLVAYKGTENSGALWASNTTQECWKY